MQQPIKKLEDIIFTDMHGNKIARRPNNDEITDKLNEVIERLNEIYPDPTRGDRP